MDKAASLQQQEARPTCVKCGSRLYQRTLVIISAECWKCRAPMKVAVLGVGRLLHPEDFFEDELAAAREHGVVLKAQFSRTQDREYLGNTCPSCGVLTGNWYASEYLDDMDVPRQEFPMGLDCEACREPKHPSI